MLISRYTEFKACVPKAKISRDSSIQERGKRLRFLLFCSRSGRFSCGFSRSAPWFSSAAPSSPGRSGFLAQRRHLITNSTQDGVQVADEYFFLINKSFLFGKQAFYQLNHRVCFTLGHTISSFFSASTLAVDRRVSTLPSFSGNKYERHLKERP